jgi:hypothetical protein
MPEQAKLLPFLQNHARCIRDTKRQAGTKQVKGCLESCIAGHLLGGGGEGGDEGRDSLEMRKRKKTKDLMLGGV